MASTNTTTGMSQTFLGYNVASIAAELDALQPVYAGINPFDAFSVVFKDMPTGVTTINVPVAQYPTGSSDQTDGPVFLNAISTGITITLDKDQGVLYKFNNVEAHNLGLPLLVKTFLQPAIYGTERTLLSASLSAGLSGLDASDTGSVRVGVANTFSGSTVAGIAGALSAANIKPDFILTSNAYFWGLISNLSSVGNAAGAQALMTGTGFNNPFGVSIIGTNLLPPMTGSFGTGNVVGIAGQRGWAVLGTSLPDVRHQNGEAFAYTSPRSGVTFLVENYYDESRRAHVIGATVLYKAVAGVPHAAVVITDKA
jgi:hypothetical protein